MSRTFDPLVLLYFFPLAEFSQEVERGCSSNGTEGKAGGLGRGGVRLTLEGAADVVIVRSSRLGQCLAPRRQTQIFSNEPATDLLTTNQTIAQALKGIVT